jgi:hypothetical protein
MWLPFFFVTYSQMVSIIRPAVVLCNSYRELIRSRQSLRTLNVGDITSMFRLVAMFVTAHIQTKFLR